MNSSPLLQQLVYALPTLLACGLGGVLAVLTFRRCALAGGLMLGAALLLILTRLAYSVAFFLIVNGGERAPAQVGSWLAILGGFNSVLGAIALAMIFIAACVGRTEAPGSTSVE